MTWPSFSASPSGRLVPASVELLPPSVVADGWGTLVGYNYGEGEARPIPDVLRERIEPQIPAPDVVG